MTATDEPVRKVVHRAASTIPLRIPRWLWKYRIPVGAITLLAGREGIGKSTLALDLAAKITRGELEGIYEGQPRGVGIVASEDAWEAVILPRLLAAGAVLDRVHQIEASIGGELISISTPRDLPGLGAACEKLDIALVIIDPVMAVIAGSLDTHKDADVRSALIPLSRHLADSSVAVLALIHVNKSNGTDPLNTVMASRAFTAVARSVLYAIEDGETGRGGEATTYLLGHAKSNLGPKQASHRYGIATHLIMLDEPDDYGEQELVTSRVDWLGEDDRSVREVLEASTAHADPAVGELATEVLAWITEQGRPVTTEEIAKEFGDVKPATLRSCLSRAVKRGSLIKPARGLFESKSATSATDATGNVARARGVCNTQQQQQLKQTDAHVAHDARCTPPRARATNSDDAPTIFKQPDTDWGEIDSWGEPPEEDLGEE